MPDAEMCPTCKRPRCTPADVDRWFIELGPNPAPDPPWARKLCWTKPGAQCHCRPGLDVEPAP